MSYPRPTTAWIERVRARNRRALGLQAAPARAGPGWKFVAVMALAGLGAALLRPRRRRRK